MAVASASTVYSLLTNAMSHDESLRKNSEAALSALENLPGFCSCLLQIISSPDLEAQNEARWLASVYFKNSINRYWRNRRDSPGIPDAEKPYLRSKLLDLVREENHRVAIQLAVLISKIARIDYPREWQDLFPTLLSQLQKPDMLLTHRVYLTLNQILKELSSKRLAVDQQNFAQVTADLFSFTWHHWYSDTQAILGGIPTFTQNQALPLVFERWLLCSKMLGRMIRFGFTSDAKSVQEVPPVQQVCPVFLQTVQQLLHYRAQGYSVHGFIEKASLKLVKILAAVQATHPFSFSKDVLPSVLDFACQQITQQNEDNTSMFGQMVMQCMLFVQAVLICEAYKPAETGRVVGQLTPTLEEAKVSLANQANAKLNLLLDNDRVLHLCQTLVTRYFVYNSKDLESWYQDAESFHHEESLTQWKDKLRPCAESLYLALFENHRQILAPYVVEALKQVSVECPPPAADAEVQITPALLSKDAVYSAVGFSHYDLHDYIDFKIWYNRALVQELANVHPNNRIMRRRVAWLFGEFVSKIDQDMRRPIYVALLRLLGDGDLAVQLAALHSLHHLIDDVHFYEEEFVEYIPTYFDLLFQFMNNAQEFDSKVQVFNLISLIIDRLGDKVTPSTEKLLLFLPQMWQNSENQILLRIQVILALQRLVVALGPSSPRCYKLLLPVLQHVTDPDQPEGLNMLEDGLQLWCTTLRHAPTMVSELLSLFPHATVAMERSMDNLQVCMEIIEGYVLLSGGEFLIRHGGAVVAIFKMVIGHVKEKGMMCALPVLDMIIQCFPADAPPLLEEALQALFLIVVNSRDESDLVKATAGAILARVLVQNSTFFAHMSAQPSLLHTLQQSGLPANQNPLILFFDSWLDKVDSLTTMSKRKVCALASCILLSSNEPQILDRLEQILSVCTSILHESQDGVLSYEGCTSEGGQSQDSRKRQIVTSDPVNNLDLAPLLKEKLQTCAALHGQAAFNVALSRCAPSLVREIQRL